MFFWDLLRRDTAKLTWIETNFNTNSQIISQTNHDPMKGLCQECFTSNVEILFNKVAEKDGLVSKICVCEKCKK